MVQPLTRRQREIYDFLRAYIAAKGYAPALEEVGQQFGLTSLATVHKHLENLKAKGWIARRHNHSRALELLTVDGMCPHCHQPTPQ